MVRRSVLGVLAVLTAVAVSGVGFAAFTQSDGLSVSASAGNLFILWDCISGPYPCDTSVVGYPNAGIGSQGYVGCSFEFLNGPEPYLSSLEISASNLAPGDSCTLPTSFGGVLGSFSSLPAILTISETSSSISCGAFTFSDNLFFTGGVALGPTTPPTSSIPIGAYSYVPAGGYTATLSLSSGAPNSCQGETDSVTWTITATAT